MFWVDVLKKNPLYIYLTVNEHIVISCNQFHFLFIYYIFSYQQRRKKRHPFLHSFKRTILVEWVYMGQFFWLSLAFKEETCLMCYMYISLCRNVKKSGQYGLIVCFHTGRVNAEILSSCQSVHSSDSAMWYSHEGQSKCLTKVHPTIWLPVGRG